MALANASYWHKFYFFVHKVCTFFLILSYMIFSCNTKKIKLITSFLSVWERNSFIYGNKPCIYILYRAGVVYNCRLVCKASCEILLLTPWCVSVSVLVRSTWNRMMVTWYKSYSTESVFSNSLAQYLTRNG